MQKNRKVAGQTLVLLLVFFFVLESSPQTKGQSPLDRRVDCGSILGKDGLDLVSALSGLASATHVPIGFEPTNFIQKNPTGSETDHSKVVECGGLTTVEDLLNTIIKMYPEYQWDMHNGLVSFYPRNERDPVIDRLLKTEVDDLVVEKRVGAMSVGEQIAESVKVRNELDSLGVTPIHIYNSLHQVRLDSKSPKLVFIKGEKVRDILDSIIRQDGPSFWTILRWGDEGEFLTILVS